MGGSSHQLDPDLPSFSMGKKPKGGGGGGGRGKKGASDDGKSTTQRKKEERELKKQLRKVRRDCVITAVSIIS